MRSLRSRRSIVAIALGLLGVVFASCTGSDAGLGSVASPPLGSTAEENPASTPGEDPAITAEESPEETASVSLALISAPSDALCLELAVTPVGTTWGGKTQLFDITPGSSPTLTLNALPSGSATVAARTFGVACAQVLASTSPTWVTAGPVSATLVAGQTIATSIVLRRPGNIQVTATFDDGALTITPTAKDFGTAQVTGYTSAALTVTNSGTAAVSLPTAPAVSGTDSTQFMVAINSCGTSVAAGATCNILMVFKPTTVGSKTATLTVANATASLTGNAVTGALTLTPNPANFPITAVGTTSTFTFTLTNSSAIAFSLGGWSIPNSSGEFGFGSGSTCGASLAASATCTMVVTFSPLVAGSKTGTLTLSAGATAAINASATSLTITPTAKDFGTAQVTGYTSAALTVTNSGTTAVSLPTAPAVSGTDSSQFMVAINSCGTSVAAGATCNILMVFKPTTVGSKTATLTVADVSASLTGNAVTGALTLTPNPANFPITAVGTTSTFTFTLTNSSAIAFSLGGWSIPNSSGEFGFGSGSTCGASLAASATCTMVVTFSPLVAGSKTGTLTLSAGATAAINASTPVTYVYRVDSGSSVANSPFTADQYYSGGTQASYTAAINVTGVTNAAPVAVYQSERYGNMTYTFSSLTASTAHTVRLHMAELYQNAAGKRLFNVSINGTAVLTNFDTYVAAGNAKNKAVVREFTTTSNSSGQIVVQFTNVTDNASISGIEILK